MPGGRVLSAIGWALKGKKAEMTEVERLEAAIEKLETLKAGSAQGEWQFAADGSESAIYDNDTGYELALIPEMFMAGNFAANADLIVTLHRTIDAQLGILRAARVVYGSGIAVPEWMTLADAILGGGS